jgi:hypothetical protein
METQVIVKISLKIGQHSENTPTKQGGNGFFTGM